MAKRIFVGLIVIISLGLLGILVGYKIFFAGKGSAKIVRTIIQTLPDNKNKQELTLISTLMGFEQPKRYLVMFQNSTEMRPTGGFFGSYGLITVANGKILSAQYGDPYTLDRSVNPSSRPASPAPIATYTGIKKWYLRDANWDPDFPTSAARVYQFFVEEGGDPNVDGVIAITSHLLPRLLDLTGPVTVAPGITFRSDTVVNELEEEVERRYVQRKIPWDDRKKMVGALGEAILNKIERMPGLWSRLFNLGNELLAQRDIQVWMRDVNLQTQIATQGWDGDVKPGSSDFLMIVDANLSALKTDPVIMRSGNYRVEVRDGHAVAHLTLRYDHRGTFDWKTTRYRFYTRVLVPRGSRLVRGTGSSKPWDQETVSGVTSFGTFFQVEPGNVGTLEVTYELPAYILDQIANKTYNLVIQKQPGVERNLSIHPPKR